MWHEARAVPVCKTKLGCEIEEEAQDPELDELFLRYRYAKMLGEQGNTTAETKILDQLGLFDDLQSLIEIENVYLDFIRIERKKQSARLGNGGRQRNQNNRYGR